jgi:tight adherence protein C
MTVEIIKAILDFLIAFLTGMQCSLMCLRLWAAEELRGEQRARRARDADSRRKVCASNSPSAYATSLTCSTCATPSPTRTLRPSPRNADFRRQNPLTRFLFFRLVPFVGLLLAAAYVFLPGGLPEKPVLIKLIVSGVGTYAVFYAPVMYVFICANKRRALIQNAWHNTLDSKVICIESGMSEEQAFRRVAGKIVAQSVDRAEMFMLTNAELSFLHERRQADENPATYTGL